MIIGLALWAKYAIEDIRGELDEDLDEAPAVAAARAEGGLA